MRASSRRPHDDAGCGELMSGLQVPQYGSLARCMSTSQVGPLHSPRRDWLQRVPGPRRRLERAARLKRASDPRGVHRSLGAGYFSAGLGVSAREALDDGSRAPDDGRPRSTIDRTREDRVFDIDVFHDPSRLL